MYVHTAYMQQPSEKYGSYPSGRRVRAPITKKKFNIYHMEASEAQAMSIGADRLVLGGFSTVQSSGVKTVVACRRVPEGRH